MASIDFSTDFGKRVLGRLQDEQVAWLTTVSTKGEPQPSPVWFLWENDSVLVYSQPNTPKLRAIQGNPNVTRSCAGRRCFGGGAGPALTLVCTFKVPALLRSQSLLARPLRQ